MGFNAVFHLSSYLLLLCGGVVFALAEDDGSFAMVLGMAIVAAHFFCERWRLIVLPRWLVNLLSIPLLPVIAFEPDLLGSTPQIALAHGIMLLQIIRLFQAKAHRDYWQLYVLSLFTVVVASLLKHGPTLGVMLTVYLVVSVWTLVVFCLRRESDDNRPGASMMHGTRGPMGRTAGVADVEFLSWRFVFGTLLACIVAIGVSGLVFLALPRTRLQSSLQQTVVSSGQAITGFSNEVELGDLGQILESNDRVMKVALRAPDGAAYEPKGIFDALWRGISLTYYDGKKWWLSAKDMAGAPLQGGSDIEEAHSLEPHKGKLIEQRVEIEELSSDVLFSLQPLVSARSDRPEDARVRINTIDGALHHSGRVKTGAFFYTTYVHIDPAFRRFKLDPLGKDRAVWERMLRPPRGAKWWRLGKARGIGREARRVLTEAGVKIRPFPTRPKGEKGKGWKRPKHWEWVARDDFEKAARALEKYLADNSEFTYSLTDAVVDTKLDPVEDFLLNRKSGHCEYYASALALMLRSVGVPARLVNGFKGSDYNALGGFHIIRNRNAHSWVEAYIPKLGRWVAFDPTPGEARLAVIKAKSNRLEAVMDYIDHLWVTYVLGYDQARQEQLLYGPARRLYFYVRDKAVDAWEATRDWAVSFFHFPDVGSFVSWRGGVVSAIAMLLLAALVWAGVLLRRRLRVWLTGGVDLSEQAKRVEFYEQLLWLLQRLGLRKRPEQTPYEFAVDCQEALAASPELANVASVPVALAREFYAVRFGDRRLDAERSRDVRRGMRALRQAARVRYKPGSDDESQAGIPALTEPAENQPVDPPADGQRDAPPPPS